MVSKAQMKAHWTPRRPRAESVPRRDFATYMSNYLNGFPLSDHNLVPGRATEKTVREKLDITVWGYYADLTHPVQAQANSSKPLTLVTV